MVQRELQEVKDRLGPRVLPVSPAQRDQLAALVRPDQLVHQVVWARLDQPVLVRRGLLVHLVLLDPLDRQALQVLRDRRVQLELQALSVPPDPQVLLVL